MPVEIRELVIRTSVDSQNNSNSTSNTNQNCTTPSANENEQVRAGEILKMIQNQNER